MVAAICVHRSASPAEVACKVAAASSPLIIRRRLQVQESASRASEPDVTNTAAVAAKASKRAVIFSLTCATSMWNRGLLRFDVKTSVRQNGDRSDPVHAANTQNVPLCRPEACTQCSTFLLCCAVFEACAETCFEHHRHLNSGFRAGVRFALLSVTVQPERISSNVRKSGRLVTPNSRYLHNVRVLAMAGALMQRGNVSIGGGHTMLA